MLFLLSFSVLNMTVSLCVESKVVYNTNVGSVNVHDDLF